MNVSICPSRASGKIAAPPSKSMAHRMLISAGLSKGESIIHNISLSEDIRATLDCLQALGASFSYDEASRTIRMKGASPEEPCKDTLFARESGSTLRFFIPLLLLSDEVRTIGGSDYLFTRPLSVYEKICAEQGLLFHRETSALTLRGPLHAGRFTVDGSISSQFISGLLFALPLLGEDSEIHLLPPVESIPYIRMTIRALQIFGLSVQYDTEAQIIRIPGRQEYKAREVTVEGDYSNAAFLDALNFLGGSVEVTGLNPDSLQGDQIYLSHYRALQGGHPEIDLSDCPDLGPVLFALAAAGHGAEFTGTRRLAMKECDRAAAMQEELLKFGMNLTVTENHVSIPDGELHAPKELLSGHNDHRIVMALASLLTVYGGEIEGAEAVRKSFPDYFNVIRDLKIKIKEEKL